MKKIDLKLSKDQIQKLALSAIGFIVLLYVYFSFFLGPLNRSRDTMLATITDLQGKDRHFEKRDDEGHQSRKAGQRGHDALRRAQSAESRKARPSPGSRRG